MIGFLNPRGTEEYRKNQVEGDYNDDFGISNKIIGNNNTTHGTKNFVLTGFNTVNGIRNIIGDRCNVIKVDGKALTMRQDLPDEDFILGVTSGNPSIVGDVYDDQWQGMYLRDVFGSPILDEEGAEILNPSYDATASYIPRGQRKEWTTVGLMGKLIMIDDGTCTPNGWATVGLNGAATESLERTKYRVMKRIDESHIQILILP